jgi:hypothetical protein
LILNVPPSENGGINGRVASEREAVTYIKENLATEINNHVQMAKALTDAINKKTTPEKKRLIYRSQLSARMSKVEILSVLDRSNNFARLVNAIYPEWMSVKEIEDLTETTHEFDTETYLTLFEEDRETQSLRDQIADNDQVNREVTLTKTLRHWLSGFVGSKGTLISDRFAYFSMLMLVSKLNLNSLVNLRQQLDEYATRNDVVGPMRAIINRLKSTLNEADATRDENYQPITKQATIVSEYDHIKKETRYFIAHTENTDLDISRIDLKKEIDTNTTYSNNVRVEEISTDNLKAVAEYGIKNFFFRDLAEFNAIYRRHRARDVIRSIQNNFGSIKDMELRILTIDNDFGKKVYRYIRGAYIGQHNSIKAMLQDAVSRQLTDNNYATSVQWARTKKLLEAKNAKDSFKTKLNGIKQFLKDIGLGEYRNVTFQNIDQLSNDIIYTMDRAKEMGNFRKLTKDGLDKVELFLDDNNSMFNNLSMIMMMNSEYLRNPSMRDGKGNSIFKFVNSDYLYDTMYKLINSQGFKGSAGTMQTIKLPSFLKTKFFKNNAFVQGKAVIRSMDYHDSQKYMTSGSTVSYTDENNFKSWIQREFVGSFLAGMRKMPGTGKLTYYQPSFTLSDRGKIPVFQVDMHTVEKVQDELIPMILQQVDERNPGLTLKYKNFDHKKMTNATFLESKDRHKIISEIEHEVNRVTKELIREEIVLPSEMKDLWNTLKLGKDNPIQASGRAGFKSYVNGKYVVTEEMLRPFVQRYVYNNYVNSYFLNQLFLGDYAYYKDGNDVLKRGAGPSAPGLAPLIDEWYGMPRTSRFALIDDETVPTDLKLKPLPEDATEEEKAEYEKMKKLGSMRAFLERFIDDKDELERILKYFGRNYDATDAQGFHTPRRHAELLKGFGKSYGLSPSTKPVYFNLQDTWVELGTKQGKGVKIKSYNTKTAAAKVAERRGYASHEFRLRETQEKGSTRFIIEVKEAVPIYLKYSSVELSNDLVERFPGLKNLRDKMDNQNIGEALFATAIKSGLPSSIMTADKALSAESENFQNVLELDNEGLRMQLNPIHDPKGHTAMPSQFMYFLNVENTIGHDNSPEARAAYEANAFLLEQGLRKFEERFVNKGMKGIVGDALRKGKANARANRLNQAGISHNNPALERISSMKFASEVIKQTMSSIKFSGGKYTLQSAWGLNNEEWAKEDIERADELNYYKTTKRVFNPDTRKMEEHESIIAQTIFPRGALPKDIEDRIEAGEEIFLQADAFAYRIPSTEIHSGVALKIVGFYDNKNTNVIVLPREIVPLHGSDFDVDALFIITRETVPSDVVIDGETVFSKDDFIGFREIELREDPEDKDKVTGTRLELDPNFITTTLAAAQEKAQKFFQEAMAKMEAEITAVEDFVPTEQKRKASTRATSLLYNDYINMMKKLEDIGYRYALNVISENMLKVIQEPKNIGRTMLPISMERFMYDYGGESIRLKLVALESKPGRTDQRAVNIDKDLSSVMGRYIAHKSVFDGKALVGVFANAVKVFAYQVNGGISPEVESLVDDVARANSKFSESNELYKELKLQLRSHISDGNYVQALEVTKQIEELEDLGERILSRTKETTAKLRALLKKEGKESYYPVIPKDYAFRIDRYLFDRQQEREVDPSAPQGPVQDTEIDDYRMGTVNYGIDEIGLLKTSYDSKTEGIFYYTVTPKGRVKKVETTKGALKTLFRTQPEVRAYMMGRKDNVILNSDGKIDHKRMSEEYEVINFQSREFMEDMIRKRRKTSDKKLHSIWETLDALINLAIDNTKEQGLYMIGANNTTANALTTMIGTGVPLETAVYMLRQPIVIELGRSKHFNTKRSIDKLLREMGELVRFPDFEAELMTEDLEDWVGKEVDFDALLEEVKEDKTKAYKLEHHYAVLQQFKKIFKAGEDLKLSSQMLQVLREPPTTIEDIAKLKGTIASIYNSVELQAGEIDDLDMFKKNPSTGTVTQNNSFAWSIQNLLKKNPHIAASFRMFELYSEAIEQYYFVASKEINELLTEKGLHTRLKLTTGADTNRTVYHNRMLLAKELTRYLISNIFKEELKNEPEFIYYDENGREVRAEGAEAWIQRFLVNYMKEIEVDNKKRYDTISYPGNYVLQHSTVKGKHNGYKSLSYSGGVNSTEEDQIFAEQNLRRLSKETQTSLLKYSMLKSGLNYALTAISNVFPPSLIASRNAEIVKILDEFRFDPRLQEQFMDHFEVQALADHGERHSWIDSNIPVIKNNRSPLRHTQGRRRVNQTEAPVYDSPNYVGMSIRVFETEEGKQKERIFYDRGYANKAKTAEEFESMYPEIMKIGSKWRTVTYLRTSKLEDKVVTYQYLGKKGKGYTPHFLNETYRKEDYFSQKFPTIKVDRYNSLKNVRGEFDLSYIPKGQVIALAKKSDVGNAGRVWVTLESSKPILLEGTDTVTGYKYTFKESQPPAFMKVTTPVEETVLNEEGEVVERKPQTFREHVIANAEEMWTIHEDFGVAIGATYFKDGKIVLTSPNFKTLKGLTAEQAQKQLDLDNYTLIKRCE